MVSHWFNLLVNATAGFLEIRLGSWHTTNPALMTMDNESDFAILQPMAHLSSLRRWFRIFAQKSSMLSIYLQICPLIYMITMTLLQSERSTSLSSSHSNSYDDHLAVAVLVICRFSPGCTTGIGGRCWRVGMVLLMRRCLQSAATHWGV